MRVLVCGSRHFDDNFILKAELEKLDVTTIIHGDCRGADRMAGAYARTWGIEEVKYPADWEREGKAAGPIRNSKMLRDGKPDLVLAFLAPNSRGTANMIEQATKANIPVKVINI